VEAVPHSANSGDCSREISNACARPLSHTSRRAASELHRPSARAHIVCGPPLVLSRFSKPPPSPGRTDLRSAPLPDDLARLSTELVPRRSLPRCGIYSPASVSVHLPASGALRARPRGRRGCRACRKEEGVTPAAVVKASTIARGSLESLKSSRLLSLSLSLCFPFHQRRSHPLARVTSPPSSFLSLLLLLLSNILPERNDERFRARIASRILTGSRRR